MRVVPDRDALAGVRASCGRLLVRRHGVLCGAHRHAFAVRPLRRKRASRDVIGALQVPEVAERQARGASATVEEGAKRSGHKGGQRSWHGPSARVL